MRYDLLDIVTRDFGRYAHAPVRDKLSFLGEAANRADVRTRSSGHEGV